MQLSETLIFFPKKFVWTLEILGLSKVSVIEFAISGAKFGKTISSE
jgi:hypothetical protein